ncbi:MAG: RedB protein [Bacteroidetes bacterium]|jgi:hypothetical protein|nr:RedB protein [Bacteroidota bacterium]
MRQHLLFGGAFGLWAIAVVVGFTLLTSYEFGAGASAEAPQTWPADASIAPAAAQGNLLVFAHPRCPCTRATIRELERLLHQAAGTVATTVFFVQPEGYDAAWVHEAALWRLAERIPGVTPRIDVQATEARRFGAITSGQVLFYDAGHVLQFSGGITASRGHEGDNIGRRAVIDLIDGRPPEHTTPPVFGCALYQQHGARS